MPNELVPTTRTLDEIAESIRAHWSATEEDRFAIGRDLLEARAQFPGDREFGAWMRAKEFPFTQQWSHTLRLAAANEPAVRRVLTSQLVGGHRRPNLERAVRMAVRPAPEHRDETYSEPEPERELSEADTAFLHEIRAYVADVVHIGDDSPERPSAGLLRKRRTLERELQATFRRVMLGAE